MLWKDRNNSTFYLQKKKKSREHQTREMLATTQFRISFSSSLSEAVKMKHNETVILLIVLHGCEA
jgi:hypothetical protein